MVSLERGDAPVIIQRAQKLGLLRNQLAYCLATAYWETNRTVKPVKEAYYLANPESYRRRLRYYPYYGRGYVQLTWDYNYLRASKKFGVDFVKNPDRVMETVYAVDILLVGCMEGWFTGRSLTQYVTLTKSDFVNARRVVNGTDKAAEIADLAHQFDALLMGVAYGVVPEPEPVTPAPTGFWAWLKGWFQ